MSDPEIANPNENGRKNHIWLKLFLLFMFLGIFSFALYETGLIKFFLNKQRMITFIESLGPWGFVGFVVLQGLQVVAAPIPGEVTGLLGGYIYGPYLGVLLSTIGLTLGSYAAFYLSRTFGKPFVDRFVSEATMQRFDYLLHHKGAFLVFLLFLIPGFPKDYLCYVLGLGHLSSLEFVVIGGTGRLFGTVLLTLGGNFIRLHQYKQFFILVGAAIIFILLAMAYKDKLEKVFREWHARKHRKESVKCPGRITRECAVSPRSDSPKLSR
jgi:uncharacterized membrane protein YdjX (TVP38/TMEM64 family)